MGETELTIETTFGVFVVRVERFATQPRTAAQQAAADKLASELRFGLSHLAPELQLAAQRLHHALFEVGPFVPRRMDASASTHRFFEQLARLLEEQLQVGRLVVVPEPNVANVPEVELTRRKPKLDAQPPQAAVPRARAPLETSFEVRWVDEVGQAIGGFEVELRADDRVEKVKTNAAGVALLEGTTAGSGTVSIVDPDALDVLLAPRWARVRNGAPPPGMNITQKVFTGQDLGTLAIKAGVANTIVLKPPLGKLSAELWDKFGRVRHANRKYTIDGPTTFAGTTDENGRLSHEDVPGGDYQLKLSVDFPPSFGLKPQSLETALVTLAPAESEPQVRLIGAAPHVEVVRLMGAFFETNKSFLLPDGVRSLADIEDVYSDNNPSQLLIVGHTDTTGDAATNDPLSLERATNTLAFLRDDVDAWLEMYEGSVPAVRRWGSREDQAMLGAVDDDTVDLTPEKRIRKFQDRRRLTVDGVAGPQTRKQLIKEYMGLDNATLSDPGFVMPITAHGCGENFPLNSGGEALDAAPADKQEDGLDRRVEFFFFDADLGIQPPPPGKNSPPGSTQYPEWRRRALASKDLKLVPPRRLTLVDEQGAPLSLEPYELLLPDGRILSGTADENGVAELPPGIGNDVTLRLVSLVAEVQLASI